MKKLDFNSGWTFRKAEEPPAARAVTLPHDAMIHEGRSAAAPGGSDNAFFPGGTYIYEKTFEAPDAAHCEVLFEGVYRNATVALNGETLATHAYGYTPFAVTLDGKLHPGANTLTVTADNADAPSGRWYTGSGIYRPVWMYTGGKGYIRREGIRVTTLSVNPAQVQVEVDASGGGTAGPVGPGGGFGQRGGPHPHGARRPALERGFSLPLHLPRHPDRRRRTAG